MNDTPDIEEKTPIESVEELSKFLAGSKFEHALVILAEPGKTMKPSIIGINTTDDFNHWAMAAIAVYFSRFGMLDSDPPPTSRAERRRARRGMN